MSENEENLAKKLGRMTRDESAKAAHTHLVLLYDQLQGDEDLGSGFIADLLAHHEPIINAIPSKRNRMNDLLYMAQKMEWWHKTSPHVTHHDRAMSLVQTAFTLSDKFISLKTHESLEMAHYSLSLVKQYQPEMNNNTPHKAMLEAKIFDGISRIMEINETRTSTKSVELSDELCVTTVSYFGNYMDGRMKQIGDRYINHCIAASHSHQMVQSLESLTQPFHLPDNDYSISEEMINFEFFAPNMAKLTKALLTHPDQHKKTVLFACKSALDILTDDYYESCYNTPEKKSEHRLYERMKEDVKSGIDAITKNKKSKTDMLQGFLNQFPYLSNDQFERHVDNDLRKFRDPNAPQP